MSPATLRHAVDVRTILYPMHRLGNKKRRTEVSRQLWVAGIRYFCDSGVGPRRRRGHHALRRSAPAPATVDLIEADSPARSVFGWLSPSKEINHATDVFLNLETDLESISFISDW